jgi:hypothetical protein
MPLEAEIYRRRPTAPSKLHGRLHSFLQSEEYSGVDNQMFLPPMGLRLSAFTGEAAAASSLKSTSIGIRSVEVPGDNDDADLPSFSALAASRVF